MLAAWRVALPLLCCGNAFGLRVKPRGGGKVLIWSSEGSAVNFWQSANGSRRKRPYVVMSIFSGRPDREDLLLRYVKELVQADELDEVHVNVVTDRTEQSNYKVLEDLARRRGMRHHRMEYDEDIYGFYAYDWKPPKTANETVIVKVDDDVVFLDVAQFSAYTTYIASHKEMFMVFANIVNNGVAAYYQQQEGVIPASIDGVNMTMEYPNFGVCGSLWNSSEKAHALHHYFVRQPERFSWTAQEHDGCIVYHPPNHARQEHFSINFFGYRHAKAKELVRQVRANGDASDEAALTGLNWNRTLCMFTQFVVSHLSFYPQHAIDGEILPMYDALAGYLHVPGW